MKFLKIVGSTFFAGHWPLIFMLVFSGCSRNEMAKGWGGTETIQLPAGKKLVNATWKDNHLWYLMRTRAADEDAATTIFQEKSSYGILEGKIIFEEK